MFSRKKEIDLSMLSRSCSVELKVWQQTCQSCITESTEFATLCINDLVLKNVLTGLHVSRGDLLEDQTTTIVL